LVDDLAARLGPVVELPSEERGFYEVEELEDASQYGTAALRVGLDRDEPIASAPTRGHQGQRVSADPRDRLLSGRVTPADEYAHVLVDEAQDLSPMQWRMLGRRGRYASWTIVGDDAQSSWPFRQEADEARAAALGEIPDRAFRLSTNYRNSAEVYELAADVARTAVPNPDLPDAVRRTGVEPRHRVVENSALDRELPGWVEEMTEAVDGT